ncbi:MAG: hypothetical protein HYU64_08205, partial [Armatimonadetes bacterium]|nr:hypothetical protein [Armatimonadota bacterium]
MMLKSLHNLLALLLVFFLLLFQPASAREAVWIPILHTNDVLGHLTGPEFTNVSGGGLARIASVLPEAREDNPNTLLLDAGNSLAGTALLNCTGGRPAIA